MILTLRFFFGMMVATMILFHGSVAHACTNPTGEEGDAMLNETHNVPQYCDGTNWIAMVGGDPATGGNYIPNAVDLSAGRPINAVSIPDTQQFSFSVWFRRQDTSGTVDRLFSFSGASANIYNPNNMSFVFLDSTNSDVIRVSPSIIFDDTQWHHIFLSFDTTDPTKQDLYIDGVEDTAATWTVTSTITPIDFDGSSTRKNISGDGNPGTFIDVEMADFWMDTSSYTDFSIEANRLKFRNASGSPVFLGGNGTLPTGEQPEFFFSGDTDNWHVNKGSVSGYSEDGTIATAQTAPGDGTKIVPSGLIGHWRLDETSGTTAFDSSGNGFDMTMAGSLTGASGSVKGNVDKALQFNGTSNYARVNSFDLDLGSNFSMAFWLKRNNNNGTSGIHFFDIRENVFSRSVIAFRGANNDIQYRDTTGTPQGAISMAYPTDGKWHHYSLTYDGSNLTAYKDGVIESTTPASITLDDINEINLSACCGLTGANFEGTIDDIRLYNRALTDDEIAEIYAAKDGIRYNASHRTPEFFDGNQFVSLRPDFPEPGNVPVFGYPDLSCPNIGDLCSDGSIYIGNNKYVEDNTGFQSRVWATTPGTNDINPDSNSDGEANLLNVQSTLSGLPAMDFCANKTQHGKFDWYLPALDEMSDMFTNAAAIDANSTINFAANDYWTSTEASGVNTQRINMSTGVSGTSSKSGNFRTRCVRRADLEITGSAGLVGHWKLDETSGTTAFDSSGNGNDGTMQNGLDATEDSSIGAVGTGLYFDATGEFVNVGDIETYDFDASNFTLSTWFKTTSNNDHGLISKRANLYVGEDGYGIKVIAGNLRGYIGDGTNGDENHSFDVVNDGKWHHAVMTVDRTGNFKKTYLDAVEVNSSNISAITGNINNSAPLEIGSSGAGRYFVGEIDDARIYNRALTAAEVTQLYQMGTPIGASTALPAGCPNIGDICDDGTFYVGLSPDGSVEMFTAPEDAPGGPIYQWNNDNTTGYVTTGITDGNDGDGNTATLVTTDSDSVTVGFQTHVAAQYCYDLVTNGADDWYLPSINELGDIFNSGFHETFGMLSGPVGDTSTSYWSSSEHDNNRANRRNSSGLGANPKSDEYNIRCVRKGPAPRCANPYGIEGAMMYNTTHDVMQYCDGARWIGIGKAP